MASRVSFFMVWYWATRSSIGTFTKFSRGSIESAVPSRRARRLGIAEGPTRLGVLGAAGGALRRARRDREPFAALAHPAHPAGRYSDHQPVRGNIGRHHGAGPDEGELAERGAADDRGVGADRRAPLHEGLAVLVLAGDVASRVQDVREHAGGTAENVVLEVDPLVDGHVVLDLHVVPDSGARHHDDVLTETRALTDHGALHHVTEVPDLRAGTYDGAFIQKTRGMNIVVGHQPITRTSGSSSTPVFFWTVFFTCSISFCTSAAVAFPRLMK